ncbi:hypothetical protein EVAR_79748_1 [Eumeta japonica]|uniref:Uncharacterized protein n=1 Tax=Eumeta variegata TaxID=151549 RepID=A0A4C1TAB1_EUMVA|nr:hypothetical protein EVAR_79748_1 [Eumeta japonica]
MRWLPITIHKHSHLPFPSVVYVSPERRRSTLALIDTLHRSTLPAAPGAVHGAPASPGRGRGADAAPALRRPPPPAARHTRAPEGPGPSAQPPPSRTGTGRPEGRAVGAARTGTGAPGGPPAHRRRGRALGAAPDRDGSARLGGAPEGRALGAARTGTGAPGRGGGPGPRHGICRPGGPGRRSPGPGRERPPLRRPEARPVGAAPDRDGSARPRRRPGAPARYMYGGTKTRFFDRGKNDLLQTILAFIAIHIRLKCLGKIVSQNRQ